MLHEVKKQCKLRLKLYIVLLGLGKYQLITTKSGATREQCFDNIVFFGGLVVNVQINMSEQETSDAKKYFGLF